jgi:pyridoxamine 5'-phosphate oxidase
MKTLQDDRTDYQAGALEEKDLPASPFDLFETWFASHRATTPVDATAMVLSTVDNGQPQSRVVLLKGLTPGGFEFYTNYQSAKGCAIEQNPNVALLFFWPNQERQVRVEGHAIPMTDKENDAYFYSRPLESQVGAVVSAQSERLEDRRELEMRFAAVLEEARGKKINRPAHWGGYRVVPTRWEFWQGRTSRLHDRMIYIPDGPDKWNTQRLNP